MSKYRVIALSVGGRSNRIFLAGEIVDGNKFPCNPDDLVKQGFLEVVEPEPEATGDSEPEGSAQVPKGDQKPEEGSEEGKKELEPEATGDLRLEKKKNK